MARLRRRVPSARLVAVARLDGFELCWHKRSVDGSGKCTVVRSIVGRAAVHGGLFTIPAADKWLLDRVEGLGSGYDELAVTVQMGDRAVSAWTYVAGSAYVDAGLRPYGWYRDLVRTGGASLGLPRDYVRALGSVETWVDPDAARDRMNRRDLPCLGERRSKTRRPSGP